MNVQPSLRIKRRYLLLEAENKIIVENVILDSLGTLGWAKAAPLFVDRGGKIILAVAREALHNVRAAFELSDAPIKVLRVSGTLKGLGLKEKRKL